jgi:hypothetical protein
MKNWHSTDNIYYCAHLAYNKGDKIKFCKYGEMSLFSASLNTYPMYKCEG